MKESYARERAKQERQLSMKKTAEHEREGSKHERGRLSIRDREAKHERGLSMRETAREPTQACERGLSMKQRGQA